ncbi:MAG: SGNH/GDSL hydrolase family protein [Clostridia bacterium]|nr:SGNH/GDSL hydrolase family protein [Clostridia bacterium]
MAKIILFQGDSITDAGRSRDNETYAGNGYPTLVKAHLGFEKPGEYLFFNRGVGGNRVPDLYARIVRDVLNLKPDFLSVLIGVNDVWHGIDLANGTGLARYERVYDAFLEEVGAELPDCRIMILEPFVLRGSATDDREDQPDRWTRFRTGVAETAAAARRVADKHGLPFVELQKKFDEACRLESPSYWLSDGVHPTAMGHELIKRAWLAAFAALASV